MPGQTPRRRRSPGAQTPRERADGVPLGRALRSAYRRPLQGEARVDSDRALRDWLRAYAKNHPRWGYRRATTMPAARAGRSTTRRSSGSGVRRACGSRSVVVASESAPRPRVHRLPSHRTWCGRSTSSSTLMSGAGRSRSASHSYQRYTLNCDEPDNVQSTIGMSIGRPQN